MCTIFIIRWFSLFWSGNWPAAMSTTTAWSPWRAPFAFPFAFPHSHSDSHSHSHATQSVSQLVIQSGSFNVQRPVAFCLLLAASWHLHDYDANATPCAFILIWCVGRTRIIIKFHKVGYFKYPAVIKRRASNRGMSGRGFGLDGNIY